jgi:Ca-activated chloride channel family protein
MPEATNHREDAPLANDSLARLLALTAERSDAFVATLEEVEGDVDLRDPAGPRSHPLAAGTRLSRGVALATGEGRAALSFDATGMRVALEPDSTLSLAPWGERDRRLGLERGSLRAWTPPESPAANFATPFGPVELRPGRSFRLALAAGGVVANDLGAHARWSDFIQSTRPTRKRTMTAQSTKRWAYAASIVGIAAVAGLATRGNWSGSERGRGSSKELRTIQTLIGSVEHDAALEPLIESGGAAGVVDRLANDARVRPAATASPAPRGGERPAGVAPAPQSRVWGESGSGNKTRVTIYRRRDRVSESATGVATPTPMPAGYTDPQWVPTRIDKRMRVRAGSESSPEAAAAKAERLRERGYQDVEVKEEGGRRNVYVGDFAEKEKTAAGELMGKLQRDGEAEARLFWVPKEVPADAPRDSEDWNGALSLIQPKGFVAPQAGMDVPADAPSGFRTIVKSSVSEFSRSRDPHTDKNAGLAPNGSEAGDTQEVRGGGSQPSRFTYDPSLGTTSVGDVYRIVQDGSPAPTTGQTGAETETRVEAHANGYVSPSGQALVASATGVAPTRPDRGQELIGFKSTADQPLSTFALDADTAAYSRARRQILEGRWPDGSGVRVEEFVNYFRQDYAAPEDGLAIHLDAAPWPFNPSGTTLLRVGVQTRSPESKPRLDAMVVFVVDVSGSMASGDKLALAQQTLLHLAAKLRPTDRVGIVSYNQQARVILWPTPASERAKIESAIEGLHAAGSTNVEHGLTTGYELALAEDGPAGPRRVFLLSDGVANSGATSPNAILERVREAAKAGVDLTALGVGMGDYNDRLLEELANKGNGVYHYIDSMDEARRALGGDLGGALEFVARDAKVQVAFNQGVVSRYRLLGYENRALADADFRRNEVDAGEIGPGHAATALYLIEFVDRAEKDGNAREIDPLATVFARWEDPATGLVREIQRSIVRTDCSASFEVSPARFQLSALAALLAETLRGDPWTADITMTEIARRASGVAGLLPDDQDATEFAYLASRLSRLEENGQRPPR